MGHVMHLVVLWQSQRPPQCKENLVSCFRAALWLHRCWKSDRTRPLRRGGVGTNFYMLPESDRLVGSTSDMDCKANLMLLAWGRKWRSSAWEVFSMYDTWDSTAVCQQQSKKLASKQCIWSLLIFCLLDPDVHLCPACVQNWSTSFGLKIQKHFC